MISDIITKNNYYQTTEIDVSCKLLDIKRNLLFFTTNYKNYEASK